MPKSLATRLEIAVAFTVKTKKTPLWKLNILERLIMAGFATT